MRKANRGQGGFAMLYVLMLMTALFAISASAFSLLYAARKQNAKDKQELSAKAGALNARPGN